MVDVTLFQANTDGDDRVARKAITLGRVDHCTPLMDDTQALAWSSEYLRSQSRHEDDVEQHASDCQRSEYSTEKLTICERETMNQSQMNVVGSVKDDRKKREEQRYRLVVYDIVGQPPQAQAGRSWLRCSLVACG